VAVTSAGSAGNARTLIASAATIALIGIALSASGNSTIGAWVTLAGLIAVIWGLHRFGRTGPDAPLVLAPRRRRKKKKRAVRDD
jgi:hypothetical protein